MNILIGKDLTNRKIYKLLMYLECYLESLFSQFQ